MIFDINRKDGSTILVGVTKIVKEENAPFIVLFYQGERVTKHIGGYEIIRAVTG